MRLRKQIADLSRAEKAQGPAKKHSKAARAELREQAEHARNALADLAVDYVAQMEMAEALVRLDYGQVLADGSGRIFRTCCGAWISARRRAMRARARPSAPCTVWVSWPSAARKRRAITTGAPRKRGTSRPCFTRRTAAIRSPNRPSTCASSPPKAAIRSRRR